MIGFWLAPCFGCFANLFLAYFIWHQNPRQRLNQVYALWGLSLAVWCGGVTALSFINSEPAAFLAARILHAGVIWVPVTGLHVCLLMSGSSYPRLLKFGYLGAVLLTISNIAGVYIGGVHLRPFGWFADAGPGFKAFSFYMPILTIPAVYSVIRRRRLAPQWQKRRFSILVLGNCSLLVAGLHDLIPVHGIKYYPGTGILVYPWGTVAACFYSLLVTWAVLHEQLLDVRVTLSRHAAQLTRLAFLVAVSFLLELLDFIAAPHGAISAYAAVSTLGVIVVSAVVTATIFPRLLGAFDEKIAHGLLGDRLEYHEQIHVVIARLPEQKSLEQLWLMVADVLCDGMKTSSAQILLLAARPFVVEYRAERGATDQKLALAALGTDCALLRYFGQPNCMWINATDPTSKFSIQGASYDAARAEAAGLGAAYVFAIPGSNRCCGFLALGEKAHGDPFTRSDLELLASLAERVGWISERFAHSQQAALTEKLQMQADMAKGVAHDVNNLLTTVSTVVQFNTLRYRPEDESTEAKLHRMAQRALRQIRDWTTEQLFFSNDFRLQRVSLPVADLLEASKSVVFYRAERRGIRLEFTSDGSTCMLDTVLCQRLIANLVSNAIDASTEGQVVTVDARRIVERNILRLSVSDHGCGIAPENLDKIYLSHFTTKDASDGERSFGLGLWIVELIVQKYEGAIHVTSKLGQGTQFVVELPFLPARDST